MIKILKKLQAMEREQDIKILFAVEAGSRAWRMASADSDYDVRFVYRRRPDHYLSLFEPNRDVIERVDGDLDIVGWDIKKALRLFAKSNPSLIEWLGSPIHYRRGEFLTSMQLMLPQYANLRAARYHYLHMAQGNYKKYLQGESVKVKKYLYVIRPLLVIRYMEKFKTIAPVNIWTLLNAVGEDVGEKFRWVMKKKSESESVIIKPVHELHDWIDAELAKDTKLWPYMGEKADLNAFYQEWVRKEWT